MRNRVIDEARSPRSRVSSAKKHIALLDTDTTERSRNPFSCRR